MGYAQMSDRTRRAVGIAAATVFALGVTAVGVRDEVHLRAPEGTAGSASATVPASPEATVTLPDHGIASGLVLPIGAVGPVLVRAATAPKRTTVERPRDPDARTPGTPIDPEGPRTPEPPVIAPNGPPVPPPAASTAQISVVVATPPALSGLPSALAPLTGTSPAATPGQDPLTGASVGLGAGTCTGVVLLGVTVGCTPPAPEQPVDVRVSAPGLPKLPIR